MDKNLKVFRDIYNDSKNYYTIVAFSNFGLAGFGERINLYCSMVVTDKEFNYSYETLLDRLKFFHSKSLIIIQLDWVLPDNEADINFNNNDNIFWAHTSIPTFFSIKSILSLRKLIGVDKSISLVIIARGLS
jgi:hypothetical protein